MQTGEDRSQLIAQKVTDTNLDLYLCCAECTVLQSSRITSQIRLTVGFPKNFLYRRKKKKNL